jgi:nitrate/nitrite transporter NarK
LIILSPYLGPLLAAFIITTQEWNWAFGVYAIETALCLIAIVLFVDETYYDRRIPMASQPARGSKLMRLIGVSQWRSRALRNSFGHAMLRPWILLSKVPVALASFYYMITFAWVVGINTTFSIFLGPLYGFGPKQIGMPHHSNCI